MKGLLHLRHLYFFILVIVLTGCSPNSRDYIDGDMHVTKEMHDAVSDYIIEKYEAIDSSTDKQFEVHKVYGTSESNRTMQIYMYSYFGGFNVSTGVENKSGHSFPVVIQLKKTDSGYEVIKYTEPKDGSEYAGSLKKIFPEKYLKMIQQDTGNIKDLEKEMTRKVELWLEEKQ